MQTTLMVGEYAITTFRTGEPWKENCYVVHHLASGNGAVIDPGGVPELIIKSVLDNGIQVRHVLLTHAHHDHVGAVTAVCRKFQITCQLHKGDARLLRHAPMYAVRFGGERIETPEPVITYEGEPVFELGMHSINVMHTPGHTQGSVCFLLDDHVFTGDTVLYEHIGRTDLPGGDAAVLKASVSKLIENLPDNMVLFPGHGKPWNARAARTWWHETLGAPAGSGVQLPSKEDSIGWK